MCHFFKQNVSFLSIVSFFIEECVIFVDCVIVSTECVIVSRNIKLCHYDTKCVSLAALGKYELFKTNILLMSFDINPVALNATQKL